MVSGAVRWKGFFNWVLSRYTTKTIKKDILYLLWISMYQIRFMKKSYYHVVNETVEYVKKVKGKDVANFVNAILRRFVKEGEHIPYPSDTIMRLSVVHSFPEWLVRRWQKRIGLQELEGLLSTLNKKPEFCLRVNTTKISIDEIQQYLENKNVLTRKGLFSPAALYVDTLTPVIESTFFKKHLIHIQDEASQLTGLAVQPEDGDCILDACAGQGTKTQQLKEMNNKVRIIAMDINIKRLRLVGNREDCICGDAIHNPFKNELFDSILVDAPCSSLGIIRKHPEIKWRRNEEDIIQLSHYQLELIKHLWNNLKKGGAIVYSVCSFEQEETTGVIERFRKEMKFELENPLPFLFNREYFLSMPHDTNMDGFFIARLKKI